MSGKIHIDQPKNLVPPGKIVEKAEKFKQHTDSWMERNANQFNPFRWTDSGEREIRRKALTEASHYLYVAEMHDDLTTPELKNALTTWANNESFYCLLRRNPTELDKLGYPLVYLSTVDQLKPDAKRTLDDILEWPETWSKSRVPARQLDLWNLCRTYGYDDHDIDLHQLLDQGYVNRYMNMAQVTQNDMYGLTHELLYYHNLGSGNDSFPDGPLEYDYPSVLQAGILRFIIEGQTDLVAELLLCGVLQRQLPPGLIRFAFSWLFDHLADDGYLSFSVESTTELKKFVGPGIGKWEGEEKTWRIYYHPTVVGGMLARVLADNWSDLLNETSKKDMNYQEEVENLITLGKVFHLFADYNLDQGARYLYDLSDTALVMEYSDVVKHAVRFLETQHRLDGTFGYWTDEKKMYSQRAEENTEARFEEELLDPLAEVCESAIGSVTANLDD